MKSDYFNKRILIIIIVLLVFVLVQILLIKKELRELRREVKAVIEKVEKIDEEKEKASEIRYIGNAKSLIFHKLECEWAKKISPYNRINFSSKEEAISKNYRPCKVCSP